MTGEKALELRGQSVFAPYMADFVGQKRAVGNKYNGAVEVLNMFDDFCVNHGVQTAALTEELYEAWSQKRPAENESTHRLRVTYVQMFSRFLYHNGVDAVSSFHMPPKCSKTFIPYIFTIEEVHRFMAAVDTQNALPIPGAPVKHLVHPVLFRVLYGCGLRAGEAAKLKIADVDLDTGAITIRMAKGGKDRMVVMSNTLAEICRVYRSRKEIQTFESDYFFPASNHGYYDVSTMYADFRKYLALAGIPHRGRGKGPRLHDFRHTFSVHVLNCWAMQGKDLYTCLPVLQQYLGHAKITATEKYLQLVPDAFSQVTESFESKFRSVFPEVADEKER